MSRNSQILFLRYSQTKLIVSFVSYCLFNPSIVCIFGTNAQSLWGFHQIKPKQYPNRKCQKNKKIIFFDFRLILLDCITNFRHKISARFSQCSTNSMHMRGVHVGLPLHVSVYRKGTQYADSNHGMMSYEIVVEGNTHFLVYITNHATVHIWCDHAKWVGTHKYCF